MILLVWHHSWFYSIESDFQWNAVFFIDRLSYIDRNKTALLLHAFQAGSSANRSLSIILLEGANIAQNINGFRYNMHPRCCRSSWADQKAGMSPKSHYNSFLIKYFHLIHTRPL
jgi:hypothetical protein